MDNKECCNPNAPIERCVVCGAGVHTCELDKPINSSYLCPAHGEGCQLTNGNWVCSEECWNIAVG
jgi:hypothetical protein